jgi:Na+/melibiose symporter-like transporter
MQQSRNGEGSSPSSGRKRNDPIFFKNWNYQKRKWNSLLKKPNLIKRINNMQKFNFGKTFLLGFGFFGVSVIWSVYNAFVPIFLETRFGMAAGFIGIFMTLDNIAALFIQPTVGVWSDSLKTRIGRRLPFILIGAPIAAVAFIFLPLAKVLPLFFIAALTLLLSMALWRTPIVALMPDITPSKFRSQANGIINLMGGVGTVIALLLGGKLYEMDATNHAYPFWLGAGLVVIAALLVFIFIREPKTFVKSEEERPNLVKSVRGIFKEKDKNTLLILGAIFFWFVSYCGIEAFFTLYAMNRLGMQPGDGSRLLSQLALLFLIFALPAGYIGAAIGRKRTIMIGIGMMTVALISMFMISPATLSIVLFSIPVLGKVPVVGIILMFTGIAWALININSLPMVVDMSDDAHIGTYTGLYYLFSTLAAIFGPILYGWIIQLSGNQYNMVMVVSPIFTILAFLTMIFVHRGEAKVSPAPHGPDENIDHPTRKTRKEPTS